MDRNKENQRCFCERIENSVGEGEGCISLPLPLVMSLVKACNKRKQISSKSRQKEVCSNESSTVGFEKYFACYSLSLCTCMLALLLFITGFI